MGRSADSQPRSGDSSPKTWWDAVSPSLNSFCLYRRRRVESEEGIPAVRFCHKNHPGNLGPVGILQRKVDVPEIRWREPIC